MTKKILSLSFLCFILLSFFSSVSAIRTPEVNYPGLTVDATTTIEDVIAYLFSFAIGVGFLVVVAMITYGGFLYLTSLDNPSRSRKAIEKISSAILGLAVLLLFVITAQIINPNLLRINLEKPDEPTMPGMVPTPFPEREVEGHLILEENPIGIYLKEELNSREQRVRIFDDLMGIKNIAKQEREFNPKVVGLSGLNKYLLTVADTCSCDRLEARCAPARLGGFAMGCDGDPCDEESRDTIKEITEENKEMTRRLLSYHEDMLREKQKLETNLRRFQELEQRMTDCQPQGITSSRDQIKRLDEFTRIGYTVDVKQHKEIDIEKYRETIFSANPVPDPLTFYCAIGGTLLEKGIFPRESPFVFSDIFDAQLARISCPYEYELGLLVDRIREITIVQISKMDILAEKLKNMITEVQNISEYISMIGGACEINCSCVPNILVWLTGNPCVTVIGVCNGEANLHGGPPGGDFGLKTGLIYDSILRIEKLEEEALVLVSEINNIMIEVSSHLGERVVITREDEHIRKMKCTCSNAAYGRGHPTGARTEEGESYLVLEEDYGESYKQVLIKDDMQHKVVNEDPFHEDNELFYTIPTREDVAPSLVTPDGAGQQVIFGGWISDIETVAVENETLKKLQDNIWGCHTLETGERWILLDATRAKDNFRFDELIIANPHPRNLFCCTIPEERPVSEEDLAIHLDAYYNTIPAETYAVLSWDDDRGCIDRWRCEPEIKIEEEVDNNQYKDASLPLKQQLACMREMLDDTEERLKEEREDDTIQIGRISYISDHRLYLPFSSCAWMGGEIEPGGCSFENLTVYGQKRVAPQYGGPECNDTLKSFAVTFSDTRNAEHIIKAAKACNPLSYVSYVIPNAYEEENIRPHIQISIAGAYGCGTN